MRIAEEVDFLREDGGCHGIDRSEVLDGERRQTVVGTIVSLRVTVEVEAEMRRQLQVLRNLPSRCYRHIEEGVLVAVLALAAAVGNHCQGVCQRVVAVLQCGVQVVGIRQQRRKGIDVLVVLIGAEQRALDERQECR